MALSPQDIRARTFTTVRKGGYDQRDVESFRTDAAAALEKALQDATAMEARARAAVGRLQALQSSGAATDEAVQATTAEGRVAPAEAETIARTLLLAQRTADATIADAEREARERREAAEAEARRAGEAERVRVEGEVQALLARRDFLESDVDHLEQFLHAQRERLSEFAAELQALTSGLGDVNRPQLSASDADHSGDVDVPQSAGAAAGAEEDEPDVAELIEQHSDDDASAEDGGEDEASPRGDSEPDPERHSLFTADEQ